MVRGRSRRSCCHRGGRNPANWWARRHSAEAVTHPCRMVWERRLSRFLLAPFLLAPDLLTPDLRMPHDILIVDDEPDIRMLIDGVLADEGYETRAAGTSDAAIAAFHTRRPSLVVLDVWLQGSRLDGIGLLELFHGEEPRD